MLNVDKLFIQLLSYIYHINENHSTFYREFWHEMIDRNIRFMFILHENKQMSHDS